MGFGAFDAWFDYFCAEANGYDFDFSSGICVAVSALVFMLETAQQVTGKGEIELVSLAAVTKINAAMIRRNPRP